MWEPQRNICWIIHRLTIELWLLSKFQNIYSINIYIEYSVLYRCVSVGKFICAFCKWAEKFYVNLAMFLQRPKGSGEWAEGSGVTARWQCLMGYATWCQKVQCTHPANCFICIIYAHSMQSQFNLRWRRLPTANCQYWKWVASGSQVVRSWFAGGAQLLSLHESMLN